MAGRGKKKVIDIDKLKALCENGESIAVICQELEIGKSTLYKNAEENSEIRSILKRRGEIHKNECVDLARIGLKEILADPKHPARATLIMFTLKTQDKWVEEKKQSIEVDNKSEDKEVVIKIVRDNKKRE